MQRGKYCCPRVPAVQPGSVPITPYHSAQYLEEQAFHQRYINKPFYTAIVLRPYDYGDAYLIDLTRRSCRCPLRNTACFYNSPTRHACDHNRPY